MRGRRLRGLFGELFAIASLVAATGRAETVLMKIDSHAVPADTTIKLVISAAPHSGNAAAAVERTLKAGEESVPVDLPRGDWALDTVGAEIWHPPQFFTTRNGEDVVVVSIWPSAVITGLIAPRDHSEVRAAILQFTPPGSQIPVLQTMQMAEGRFKCAVPAGTLDLRVRARGHVARYFWGKVVAAGQTVDLGRIDVERGASLVGEVIPARGVRVDALKVVVHAIPAEASGRSATMTALRVSPNARGFFHLDGVSPGRYVITARYNEMTSQSVTVDVIADAEAHLRDALTIAKPSTLSIAISPPLDPDQQPWQVTVDRAVTSKHFETHSSERASTAGELSLRRLPNGTYRLNIGPAAGGTWLVREIELDGDETLPIAIPSHSARGRVRLGDKPLAAQLSFGGEFGTRVIETRSGEDGEFRVDLPGASDEVWDVAVESEAPRVHRTVHEVRVSEEIHIDLPVTLLEGEVVDESGVRVKDVFVNLNSSDGSLTQFGPEQDGTFFVSGLSPGVYALNATGFLLESETVKVTIPEDGVTEHVRLTVKANRQLKGRVLSASGPVPGALVVALPTDVPAMIVLHATSDERGEFVTVLPPGCREVDVFVSAPGFSFRSFHTTLQRSDLSITVGQDGGTLVAHWNPSEGDPFVFHAGAMYPMDRLVLSWTARATSSEGRDELSVPQMEQGSYTVCLLTAEERGLLRTRRDWIPPAAWCASAYVPPFGSTSVELHRK